MSAARCGEGLRNNLVATRAVVGTVVECEPGPAKIADQLAPRKLHLGEEDRLLRVPIDWEIRDHAGGKTRTRGGHHRQPVLRGLAFGIRALDQAPDLGQVVGEERTEEMLPQQLLQLLLREPQAPGRAAGQRTQAIPELGAFTVHLSADVAPNGLTDVAANAWLTRMDLEAGRLPVAVVAPSRFREAQVVRLVRRPVVRHEVGAGRALLARHLARVRKVELDAGLEPAFGAEHVRPDSLTREHLIRERHVEDVRDQHLGRQCRSPLLQACSVRHLPLSPVLEQVVVHHADDRVGPLTPDVLRVRSGQEHIGSKPSPLVPAETVDISLIAQVELARLEDESIHAALQQLALDVAVCGHIPLVGPSPRALFVLEIETAIDDDADAVRMGILDQIRQEVVSVCRMCPPDRMLSLLRIPERELDLRGTALLMALQSKRELPIRTQRQQIEAVLGQEPYRSPPFVNPPMRDAVRASVAEIPCPLRADAAHRQRRFVGDLHLRHNDSMRLSTQKLEERAHAVQNAHIVAQYASSDSPLPMLSGR